MRRLRRFGARARADEFGRQRFKSPNDYLFNRVFDQPTQVDPDSGLLTAGPPAATSLRLRDNDFPYDVTPGTCLDRVRITPLSLR